jgi:hypothetical protein
VKPEPTARSSSSLAEPLGLRLKRMVPEKMIGSWGMMARAERSV